jgi:muramoyltetrapeptide carboxypeptidase
MSKIVVVAPSGPLPKVEFSQGLGYLVHKGFEIELMPQVLANHLWYAGTDEARAEAFIEAAYESDATTVLCARGGYGAARIFEALDRVTQKRGKPPRKTLMGYSDITALHVYVRERWGWRTVHSIMPAAKEFTRLKPKVWKAWRDYALGQQSVLPQAKMKCLFKPKRAGEVSGTLIGGNMAVWNGLFGTPWQPKTRNSVLFLEDTFEQPYQLDRMVQRMLHSGGFEGVRAVVLGTFFGCEDKPPVAGSGPLRTKIPFQKALSEVFAPVAYKYGIGIWAGLPVGHGPVGTESLELGIKVGLKGGRLLR